MASRDTALYALIGFLVWLSGAVLFRLSGALLFENGPFVLAAAALGIAASVCLLLKATMDWRKAPASDAVRVAVVMALPGLFADVAYILAFRQLSGLQPITAGPYAALIIFGNACLLAFALWRARGARPIP
jgi:hypothetical protein